MHSYSNAYSNREGLAGLIMTVMQYVQPLLQLCASFGVFYRKTSREPRRARPKNQQTAEKGPSQPAPTASGDATAHGCSTHPRSSICSPEPQYPGKSTRIFHFAPNWPIWPCKAANTAQKYAEIKYSLHAIDQQIWFPQTANRKLIKTEIDQQIKSDFIVKHLKTPQYHDFRG